MSAVIAAVCAVVVFVMLYPGDYKNICGGRELFILLTSVDVVLGPLLTFTVFSPKKSKRELTKDLSVVALLQIAALMYGLWTVYVARPVYLVHEVDRFQVVTATDLDPTEIAEALPEFRTPPRWGVEVIGVRQARSEEEKLKSLDQALAGRDVAMRPGWWVPLGAQHIEIMTQKGKPLSLLKSRKGYDNDRVEGMLRSSNLKDTDVLAFPVVARNTSWSVLVDVKSLRPIGFVPVDGF